MRVQVYWNFNRKLFSIRMKSGPTHYVVAHASAVLLEDANFHVSERGRQRVLRDKRKNVHATVTGKLLGMVGKSTIRGKSLDFNSLQYLFENLDQMMLVQNDGVAVFYNPYHHETFVTRIGWLATARVHRAEFVALDTDYAHSNMTALNIQP